MRNSLKGVPYAKQKRLPGVTFAEVSCSAKLSPVAFVETAGKRRPIPQGPFCSSTYVSIRSTCPSSCAFKDNGCYAQVGPSRRIMQILDEAKAWGGSVIESESELIHLAFGGGRVPQDGARGGRDLRLHVGGDAYSAPSASTLAGAANSWRRRGGGAVWTYTHRWREIPRSAWGEISVWASCETYEDVANANARGYRAAIVREMFLTDRLHRTQRVLPDRGPGIRILPCPYETRGVTCVKCRLCLDAPIDKDIVIGFRAHGEGARKARSALNKLRLEVVSG